MPRTNSAVATALSEQRHLVVEAGTGVGKSLAYLVPAVMWALEKKKKAVISTYTINLQEQLVYKDIPIVQKVLPVEFEAMLWKGPPSGTSATAMPNEARWSRHSASCSASAARNAT